jgi:hypothetical protein
MLLDRLTIRVRTSQMRSAELSFHHCNWCDTAFDRVFVRCPVCHNSGHDRRLRWLVMLCCAVLGTLYVFAFWSICVLVRAVGRDASATIPPGGCYAP